MPVNTLRGSGLVLAPGQFDALYGAIVGLYEREQNSLPSDHVWREGKLQHAQETAEAVGAWCRQMMLPLAIREIATLASLAHDLGRFPQAVQQVAGTRTDPTKHGQLSVGLLEHLKPEFGDAWMIFAGAVENHSLRQTPPKESFSSLEAWALCCVLRDFDKAEGFKGATLYTSDQAYKAKQAQANKLAFADNNPTAEMHSIMTLPGRPDVLEAFLRGEPIVRAHCASYEAYMLQLLAWLYDFNVREVREQVILDGGPAIVLGYLRAQLGTVSPHYQRISRQAHYKWDLHV